MNQKILAILVVAILPGLSTAQAPQKYQCSNGGLERRVEIFYETGVTVPCEVHYFKDTEAPGETQVLWRALNEAGYCEKMAASFIDKLRDMGWSCGPGGGSGEDASVPGQSKGAEEDTEPAESDDTDALEPADDIEPAEE